MVYKMRSSDILLKCVRQREAQNRNSAVEKGIHTLYYGIIYMNIHKFIQTDVFYMLQLIISKIHTNTEGKYNGIYHYL